jgi:putative lipoic acid-binding regulatory protein
MVDLSPQLDADGKLTFPCHFSVKAMGAASDDFDLHVFSLARRHIPELAENALHARPSRGGRFVSITLHFTAESREQLDALYRTLSADERIHFVL